MRWGCILIFITLGATKGWAQPSVTIGQASDNTFTQGEPAKFLYTNPSDTSRSSWLTQGFLDAGYQFRMGIDHFMKVSVNYEIQKNTLIAKKQDVRQLGVTLNYVREFLDDNGIAKSRFNPTFTIKNSNDKEKEEEGMQYILGITHFAANNGTMASTLKSILTPGLLLNVKGVLAFESNYVVGYSGSKADKGKLIFIYGTGKLNMYLAPEWFQKSLNNPRSIFFYGGWTGRASVENQINAETNNPSSIGAGFDISLLSLAQAINPRATASQNKFVIKYEWISGADPLKGLQNQEYTQLSINLSVGL